MENKKLASGSQPTKIIPVQWDAAYFFERAVQSLDKFHYEKALKYFRKVVEYEPQNSVNHCNMAGVLSEMGNYAESNRILNHILESVDQNLIECYFYMANNYANMHEFEAAEKALIHYLEHDPHGHFLEEAEEMMEYLSYELERPMKIRNIKSREPLFEHDKARQLLEDGKFVEAVRVLEQLVVKYPDFLAAHNNLALAYYYIGDIEKTLLCIDRVLEMDPGNLHALCNLAVFGQYSGMQKELAPVVQLLTKTYPFQHEHVFKLATTMGILGHHNEAYRHFKRLLKAGDETIDPSLYHYAAVSAFNTERFGEARELWHRAERLDPQSDIARFYLSELDNMVAAGHTKLNYHYHLPFEERHRTKGRSANEQFREITRDPLARSSFFWALRHGDYDTKLQVIQAIMLFKDNELEDALRKLLLKPEEDEYIKKLAIYVLRRIGVKERIQALIEGRMVTLTPSKPYLPANMPNWDIRWQLVLDSAYRRTNKRFDTVQQFDMETIWIQYLSLIAPQTPVIHKPLGWSAAIEYLVATLHQIPVTYKELAVKYGVSVSTIGKHVKTIDQVCRIRERSGL